MERGRDVERMRRSYWLRGGSWMKRGVLIGCEGLLLFQDSHMIFSHERPRVDEARLFLTRGPCKRTSIEKNRTLVMAALTFGCFITTAFKDRRVPVDIHVSKVML
ncbi:hypothetical protein WMY93_006481 [Mugilogobius chulae]|uniref:Uncharacterized protein n=1 Tax=Mugilogobius chulae TaxID=88201 RepID=A0AAW0PWH8_9GOBI